MDKIRSFIAIELPDNIKRELGRLQARLRTDGIRIRWVDPSSIHLTLKFLGDIPLSSVEPVRCALAGCAAQVAPFRLGVGQPGAFPDFRRVQVVWVGLGGDLDSVCRLRQLIEDKLSPLGFAADKRPFSPHLTLGRVGDDALPDERLRLGKVLQNTAFGCRETFPVEEIVFMKSQLAPGGAIHTRLCSVQLNGESKRGGSPS